MTYLEALEMALTKENSSIKLYTEFGMKYPTLRDLFSSLADEERKHLKMIEKKISELMK